VVETRRPCPANEDINIEQDEDIPQFLLSNALITIPDDAFLKGTISRAPRAYKHRNPEAANVSVLYLL
jgi:hypothetical protein